MSAHVPASELHDLAVAYRTRYPAEPVEAIEAALLTSWRERLPLATHLASLAHDDFVNSRLEDLDGWILSRTEARLIVLAVSDERP
jgi:hypothetical protein